MRRSASTPTGIKAHIHHRTMSTQPATDLPAIREATDIDAPAWDEALASLPGASFYHLYAWRSIFEQEFGHECVYLIAEQDGAIAGLLPVVRIRSRLFGNRHCSVPFLNFGGIAAVDEVVEAALLAAARQAANDDGADLLEIRSSRPLPAEVEPGLHKVSMTLDLAPGEEALWSGFSSKHRTAIRRAYKNDLSVQVGHLEHLDAFYDVMAEAWRDLGTPFYRKRFFRSILETLGPRSRIYVCRHGETPVSVALNGDWGGIEEGLWTGSLGPARRLQPSYVLYWEMMQDACRRGQRQFHLGRSSTDSGGESFKKKWRAEPKQLYWYQWSSDGEVAALRTDNPKYQRAIAIWRRLPVSVTTRLGPWLSRSIP
jgi:FemAB-related protein (PEP-CTERM system-associated)